MNIRFFLSLLSVTLLCNSILSQIQVVGAMKNVMWKGQLQGIIDLDTIKNQKHLYGMGPIEDLSGEILILDGHFYQSHVLSDTSMTVNESSKVKAPFFAYQSIENWEELNLPDSIIDLKSLENFLFNSQDSLFKSGLSQPFFFKISAIIEEANIHIVNHPKGKKVKSPEDAHQGQKNYILKSEKIELLGFFSTEHQTIFTHHDTFLHLHLITDDKMKMGHLESIIFQKDQIKLEIPKN
jgi:acetolactate decarboxylase